VKRESITNSGVYGSTERRLGEFVGVGHWSKLFFLSLFMKRCCIYFISKPQNPTYFTITAYYGKPIITLWGVNNL